jgi:glyoxylase-like metal-dependent hydrolase (beta-lactamase superfamily II)
MLAIANHVYIEDQYPGVTLGAIALPHGLVQIDAPPSPEDGRSWRAALLNLNTGVERLLVNLDTHPDRTLGVRAMDCTVIAHEKTALAFRNQPNTFKAQGEETGADWEAVVGLGSVRWAVPEISFTSRFSIEWSNFPIVLEHHPGPAAGAIWVTLPEERIVFVGDLVVKNQPPFLASANLPEWIKSLQFLLSPAYQNYTVVSGRSGVVAPQVVQAQLTFISDLHEKIENVARAGGGPDGLESLLQPMLTGLKPPADRLKQYTQRLRHGLNHYFLRRYRPNTAPDYEE